MKKFAIVTPVKDEINYFPKTINSIINQETKPNKWIIIDDGSTDGTTEIIRQLDSEYGWIECIYREPNKVRKPGGEFVLEIGINRLNFEDYDFIVRMDGDLEFDKTYFKHLLKEFDNDQKLGIASGVCFITRNGKQIEEKHPRLQANMIGWRTRSFSNLRIHHLKKTQSSGGIFKGSFNHGIASYNSGYHPLFVLSKAIYIIIKRRYKLNSIGLLCGYFSSVIMFKPKPIDNKLIKYIRKQQMNKILGKETIWK
jgi:glycosyltransferase involved in cell wall biosynthesis